jgi:hypothetical protein
LSSRFLGGGGGVIWDGIPFEIPVIPAKAGIHLIEGAHEEKARVKGERVDSRFRGNDIVSLLALQWAGLGGGFPPFGKLRASFSRE